MNAERFYTLKELSDLLGLHEKTLLRFVHEGKIKARKLGRAWKVSQKDLAEYTHGELKQENLIPAPLDNQALVQCTLVLEFQGSEGPDQDALSRTLLGALASKDPEWGPVHFEHSHNPATGKTRMRLGGSPEFLGAILALVGNLERGKTGDSHAQKQ